MASARHDLTKIIHDHYPEITGIHPAATIFPMMGPDELNSLVENMAERGLANDIVLTPDGRLLDGRNRLLAAYLTGQEVRFTRIDPPDPIAWSWAQNGERRHLTPTQKAAIGAEMRAAYDVAAKQRQSTNNIPKSKQTLPEFFPEAGEARVKVGKTVGVNEKYIDMARDVRLHDPEAFEKMKQGDVSVTVAYKAVAPAVRAAKAEAAEMKAPTSASTPVVTSDGRATMVPTPRHTQFNRTNANVEWASWTWNPVTGCLHGCSFCYARAIVHNEQMAPNYPFAFEPAFYRHRLDAPVNTKLPTSTDPRDGRVFVGSMTDLFGKWVPDVWISAVFDACMTAPEWEYLFLTKWPKRYSLLASLPRAWFGASVIQQADVARVEANMKAFRVAPGAVKWVSLEPMLEPIVFRDLSWCDLMVIGGQTATRQPTGYVPEKAPQFDWVVDVVSQCRAFGVPYYLKPNLSTNPGMILPKGMPRGTTATTLPF